jgi:hypothetical protein
MNKKDELKNQLEPILKNREALEHYLTSNSNLPGPRSNLELAFAFAEVYDNLPVLFDWLVISKEQADVNNPKSFLAFCATVCLGKIYPKTKDPYLIDLLKKSANDGRWRMREGVAFAFQFIGENNFDELKKIFSEWIHNSNNLEKRAMLASLAHPKFLNEQNAQFCFEIAEIVLTNMDLSDNFDTLRKGLYYSLSVYVAANPKEGFEFVERWIGKNRIIDKIMKENLKKNRLAKKYPNKVTTILDRIK